MYTFAKLQDLFRVGRKIWCTNNAQNSRTLASIAFNLATNNEYVHGEFSWSYTFLKSNFSKWQLAINGVDHPLFYQKAMEALLKDSSSGIIYKRELSNLYSYISVFYNKQDKYQRQTVSQQLNSSGPRTFLTEKKLMRYFEHCCSNKNAKQLIMDILYFDRDCDAMDEAIRELDDHYHSHTPEPEYVEPDYTVPYVFEKEKLLTNSAMAKNLAKSGKQVKGVLTSEEMQAKVDAGQTITCIRDNNIFFFSDDYCIGVKYLPECICSSSTVIPHNVAPREEFPSGVVTNVKDYISIYQKDKRHIQTVDELIDYLNTTYSRVPEVVK